MPSAGRSKYGPLPRVMSPVAIQRLREKLLDGGKGLSQHEVLMLLGSHEQLRAFCLAARHRAAALEAENETLLQAMKVRK